jgi:hypothetical protein
VYLTGKLLKVIILKLIDPPEILLKAEENLPGLPGKQPKACHLCYYALIWSIATMERMIRYLEGVQSLCDVWFCRNLVGSAVLERHVNLRQYCIRLKILGKLPKVPDWWGYFTTAPVFTT